jgi:hypothetical protein
MNAEESRSLIEAAGGNKAFAMQLGIDVLNDKYYASRISQWKLRGIPPRVQLDKRKQLAAIKRSAAQRGAL